MSLRSSSGENRPFATLRQFIRERAPVEVCEMCSAHLAVEHQHLIDPSSRKLICACQPCAILFSNQGGAKYLRVQQRYRFLQNFQLSDAQWESLMIPINMAFFFTSTVTNQVVAIYPSPAGPTESLLSLDAWEEIVQANPLLQQLEPDVEALLVNRVASGRGLGEAEYYLVPIDECYKLVGLIRLHWRGLAGGTVVWQELAAFFASLKARATTDGVEADA